MGGCALIKNLMAKLGKGGAKVDLVLEKEDYLPGEEMKGELQIQGGTVDQQINQIQVDLKISVRVKEKTLSQTIQSFPFQQAFTVQSAERRSFPFQYRLPEDLPISGNNVFYTLDTRLDIAAGVDHLDHDIIRIHPPQPLQKVLDIFSRLGFREKHDSRSFTGQTQEFELFPTDFLQGQVEEVEFIAALEDSGLRLLLEVDVFTGFGKQEARRELFLENELLDDETHLQEYLREVLTEMVNNPSSMPHPSMQSHAAKSGPNWGGMVGGFAAGILGGMVLSELADGGLDGLSETIEEATDFGLPDGGELMGDMGDFFGGDDED